ncbi:MAG: Uma2 family endonuclease, partial [Gemmatimonadota bacterium]
MIAKPASNGEETYTLDEFLRLPEEDAYRIELVRGRLVREPRPAPRHARVLMRISRLLDEHAEATGRGVVLPDAGFVLEDRPPTVRGPDVAFVARD